jgi:hypothetical protein
MGCELCGRNVPLTDHHLIPRAVRSKKRYINRFGKKEMRSRVAEVCQLCHSGIHDIFTEKQLADEYNTVDLLLEHKQIIKHIKWVRKQK